MKRPYHGAATQGFESAVQAILNGQHVATPLRCFSSKDAELAAQCLQRLRTATFGDHASQHLWTAMIDARNQVLLGDPAAGLKV